MITDWLIYCVVVWGCTALINATAFKHSGGSRLTIIVLTVVALFVNLFALTILQEYRYEMLSEQIGRPVEPKQAIDFFGTVVFTWLFYMRLRKFSAGTDDTPADTTANLVAPVIALETAAPISKTPQDEMTEFGIIYSNGFYRYQQYQYEKLQDAVNYARQERARVYRCK